MAGGTRAPGPGLPCDVGVLRPFDLPGAGLEQRMVPAGMAPSLPCADRLPIVHPASDGSCTICCNSIHPAPIEIDMGRGRRPSGEIRERRPQEIPPEERAPPRKSRTRCSSSPPTNRPASPAASWSSTGADCSLMHPADWYYLVAAPIRANRRHRPVSWVPYPVGRHSIPTKPDHPHEGEDYDEETDRTSARARRQEPDQT